MRRDDRLLIPVTYGFSVRYLVPTGVLEGLSEVCTPVVAIGWHDPELRSLLEGRGIEVVRLPEAVLDHDYRMLRRQLAVLHERRVASPTTRIRNARNLASYESARARALSRVRRVRDVGFVSLPGAARRLEASETRAVEHGTNIADFSQLIDQVRADAVLSVTPYHDQDGLLLWAAARAGVRTTSSVISFDNPTTRARPIAPSDQILVWNRHNAQELIRSYPGLDPATLHIIGAPQFDLHHRRDLVMSRSDWLESIGAPADRPIVLYGSSPEILVPGEAELLRCIDELIDTGRIDGEPYVIVRPHPVEPAERWSGLALRHGHVTPAWGSNADRFRAWPSTEELAQQMSTLAHSAVHVNVCSSMTLDGAVFDRPQIGPAFVPGATRRVRRQVRSLYRQEHWQPIARSGGLATVSTEAQLARRISESLVAPAAASDGRRRMLEEVLTFLDGESSARLVARVAAH